MLVLAPTALAQAINQKIPYSNTFASSCTGEEVTYEGTLHLVGNFVKDSSGGVHFKGHSNLQAKGVGPSGDRYVITSGQNTSNKIDLESDSAGIFATTFNVNIIHQGEDGTEDDFKGEQKFHFTTNANGELTAVFENIEAECH